MSTPSSEDDKMKEIEEAGVYLPRLEEEGPPPPITKKSTTAENLRASATPQEEEDIVRGAKLFHHMAAHPWPYLLFWPIVFCLLIGFGWTRDDKIEDSVGNIWIPQRGDYANDQEYANSLGKGRRGSSAFLAMAIARDGGNLFTADRLEEIRARMEEAERTTIEYKGITYYWEDFCSGGPYEFPCARLSPMDFFQEANWFMNVDLSTEGAYNNETVPAPRQDLYRRTWYKELVQKLLVRPLMPRFWIMKSKCAGPEHCANLLGFRMEPTSPGYNPMALFGDILNLQMNDPCRMCTEANYEATIMELTPEVKQDFYSIASGLKNYVETSGDGSFAEKEQQALLIAETLTTNDVEDFFFYIATRRVYAQLGARPYVENYALLAERIQQCQQFAELLGLACPQTTIVNQTQAEQALLNHADANFSSVTTAGAPLPLWSSSDGTGYLFQGDETTGELHPVGGSGIDMSAESDSLRFYLNRTVGINMTIDPTSEAWKEQVEKNPIYAWFMANLTFADENTACGNGYLTGTNLPSMDDINNQTRALAEAVSQSWCTLHNIPNTNNAGQGPYTKQFFARMWYDLLIASESFLGVRQGVDDPYTWTTGQGCNYTLGGGRYSYTNMSEDSILYNASRPLYFIDEGASVGVISPQLIMGDVTPSIQNVSWNNSLQKVGVIQTLYSSLETPDIVQRVRHCKRPNDGPVAITEEDAGEILYQWKEAMEKSWYKGWDDEDDGEVQFVAFWDDAGAVGTTGRMLREITLDNNKLMSLAIVFIALFSALFLFSFDPVESRVLITLVGVALVVLAFFAALGFAILIGNKISVTIAWTLPFIILGLGVDDMYIVLMAVRKQSGYKERHFLKAMKDVIVPVTMTSLVNASMFAILNVSDIPAIYITAQVADYCVILLFCAIVFCFPAFVYLDLKRQAAGRKDIFVCSKKAGNPTDPKKEDIREIYLYERFYESLVLGGNRVQMVSHLVIWLIAAGLFAAGVYGLTQSEVGLGMEEFFPSDTQAGTWATQRTENLASWPIAMNWGKINYTDPSTQLQMIKQFEQVVSTPHVEDVDTKRLWLADFLLWTTTHCSANFVRDDFDVRECGRDKVFPENNNTCSATWTKNVLRLRNQVIEDIITLDPDPVCIPQAGGICRFGDQMHPSDIEDLGWNPNRPEFYRTESFCPTVEGWSPEQWQYCLVEWRKATGHPGGGFFFDEALGSATDCEGAYNNDQNFTWPIPFSSGPLVYSYDLFSHEDTMDMMAETRKFCDDDEELHCWLTGIPYDYWSQYNGIFNVFLELAGYSTVAGFAIAWIFLFGKLMSEKLYATSKIFFGSLIGAVLIAVTIILSLVTVAGISILAGVSLTGFSNMSFVLSVGFAVEYSVHIVARFIRADMKYETGLDRVKHTMSFLMLPTFMSFVSSLIGVVCLAFTEFDFNFTYFFKPLIIVMFATYFYGCWWLPALLTLLNFDVVKLGKRDTGALDRSNFPPAVTEEKAAVGDETHWEGAQEETETLVIHADDDEAAGIAIHEKYESEDPSGA